MRAERMPSCQASLNEDIASARSADRVSRISGRYRLAHLFVVAISRVGVDQIDAGSWLRAGRSSMWNAVDADHPGGSSRTSPGSATPGARPASNPFPPRLAVVTISDMRRSRVCLDESYRVLGRFDQVDPVLVDEARDSSLSHLWPVRDWNRTGISKRSWPSPLQACRGQDLRPCPPSRAERCSSPAKPLRSGGFMQPRAG
jgi:hypothetical protein